MPAVLPATLTPRTVGSRAREALGSDGTGARMREALGSASAGPRARDPLGSGGLGARAREALGSAGSWDRRFRLSLEAQRLRDLRLHPHDLSLFSSNQFHLYRLDGRVVGTWPTPRWEWVPAGRRRQERLGAVGRFEPLHLPAFELPPRYHNVPTPPNLHFTHMDMNQAYGGKRPVSGGNGTSSGASGASSAVGAGAAVLALAALVLLARAFERCLDQRLFKLLRRRSNEWYTPNVLATSHREEGAETGLECPDVSLPPGDPPPPYSMCLPKNPEAGSAEPPPPYSACYVAFPHDLPRVHLNVPTPRSFQDTGQAEDAQVGVPVGTEAPLGSRDGNTNVAEFRTNSDVASQGATVFQIV